MNVQKLLCFLITGSFGDPLYEYALAYGHIDYQPLKLILVGSSRLTALEMLHSRCLCFYAKHKVQV